MGPCSTSEHRRREPQDRQPAPGVHAAMNALIFIIVLLFGNADISPVGVVVVWAFLIVVEWLADSFAGWLILHRQSEVTQIS